MLNTFLDGKRLAIVSLVLLLNACSTIDTSQQLPTPNYQELYLRGVFNWWEAEEKYKVVKVKDGLFRSQVELIADGEPYDFRFADKDWTPGLTCGTRSNGGQLIRLGRRLVADCFEGLNNFKFYPDKTGVYEFFIDFNLGSKPLVYIRLLTH